MYIACPSCDTKFVILPEQIGASGRKVKCSKCGNIWHQLLKDHGRLEPMATANTDSVRPIFGSGINLPALLPIKIPQYLYTLPILLISLIIALSIILFPDMFGIQPLTNSNELSVKDVHVENSKDADKIIISYKIANSSNYVKVMPLVRIRLFDENKRILKSHIDNQTNVSLAPKQYISIKTEFSSVPPSTEHVDITLGNKIDFILR
jgi:predicted Zn finger-like uncharacterized protein